MPSDKYKNRSDREFAELDYDTRHAFWWAWKWVAACVVAVLVIVVALWSTGVLWAGPKGAGDAHKTKQSGANRIAAQERFEELYAEVKASDQRIGVAYEAKKAASDDVIAVTNYTGALQYCITVRAQYDADARKYTAAEWRSTDLPQQIDQQDPATDCREPKESK